MNRFDTVTATFAPRRKDDLRPGAEAWIGRSAEWLAAWLIEESDGGPYVGEFAMTPRVPAGEVLPFAWVPSGDLRLEDDDEDREQREAFETWYPVEYQPDRELYLARSDYGYAHRGTNAAWCGWLARGRFEREKRRKETQSRAS